MLGRSLCVFLVNKIRLYIVLQIFFNLNFKYLLPFTIYSELINSQLFLPRCWYNLKIRVIIITFPWNISEPRLEMISSVIPLMRLDQLKPFHSKATIRTVISLALFIRSRSRCPAISRNRWKHILKKLKSRPNQIAHHFRTSMRNYFNSQSIKAFPKLFKVIIMLMSLPKFPHIQLPQ